MRKFLAVAFAVGFTLASAGAASAEGGCGAGWHRGPYGHCRRNEGPAVVVGVPGLGVVVGAPRGRACPWHYHLGPYGHCRPD